jgi:hypothetical protein
MAVTLAMAVGIVVIDLRHEFASYSSGIASVNEETDRLKRQAGEDEKRRADAREEVKRRKLLESRDRMMAILIAPDRRTIKLSAPNPGEPATATLSISEKLGGAVLSARGLPSPPASQVYAAWWMLKNAPPTRAAEFVSSIDGSVSEYLDSLPQGSGPISFSITTEPSGGGVALRGPVKLQGKVTGSDPQTTTGQGNHGGPRFAGKWRMKLGHLVALGLLGWYLMVRPLNLVGHEIDRTAPPNRWSVIGSFSTQGKCTKAMIDSQGQPIYRAAICIPSDDPRLKSD